MTPSSSPSLLAPSARLPPSSLVVIQLWKPPKPQSRAARRLRRARRFWPPAHLSFHTCSFDGAHIAEGAQRKLTTYVALPLFPKRLGCFFIRADQPMTLPLLAFTGAPG